MSNNNYLSLVNPRLLDAIDQKKQVFDSLSRYHLPYSAKKRKQLQLDAARHSVNVELVGYDTRTANGRRRKSNDRKAGERNLFNALEWGLSNYSVALTEDFILGVGERVEPSMNFTGYRYLEARPKYGSRFYTSPERIEGEINCFLFQNNSLDHSIEKAIHAHFHIAKIHPFSDGNGRVARLVQNIVLEKEGYLPVTISLDERKKYLDILGAARESHNEAVNHSLDDNSSRYCELLRVLSKPSITLKEAWYCRELSLYSHLAHVTPEKTQFYDFIAQKVFDQLNLEVEKVKSNSDGCGLFSKRKARSKSSL